MFKKISTWIIALVASISTVGILQIVSINPKNNKIEELNEKVEEQIVAIADRDTTIKIKGTQISDLQLLTRQITNEAKEDSINHASQVRQFQSLIRGQVAEIKNKQQLITHLETGVRVDLVTLTFRKRFIGSDQLLDSTYQKGWKFGELQ